VASIPIPARGESAILLGGKLSVAEKPQTRGMRSGDDMTFRVREGPDDLGSFAGADPCAFDSVSA